MEEGNSSFSFIFKKNYSLFFSTILKFCLTQFLIQFHNFHSIHDSIFIRKKLLLNQFDSFL